MKSLDTNRISKIHTAFANAVNSWKENVPAHVRQTTDIEVVNEFFNSLIKDYNGRIRFEFEHPGDMESMMSFSYEFDTPEDEAIFILRW